MIFVATHSHPKQQQLTTEKGTTNDHNFNESTFHHFAHIAICNFSVNLNASRFTKFIPSKFKHFLLRSVNIKFTKFTPTN